MHANHSFDSSASMSKIDEECNFCSPEAGHRLIINWSPQETNKFISNRRFASPRVLSKSVPRRKKSLFRYRINRSLNFDIGCGKNDGTFKSPSSGSDSSCFDGDGQLTRSAKIMRALHFNCSPLHKSKKIKKSLNFDLSPSPKKFTKLQKSPGRLSDSNLNLPLNRSNKMLNFDTSPSDSNVSSLLATSSESIDENQNQTPSQRNRSVKKSLNYLTPNIKINRSFESNYASPVLRSGLKDKIDNIVHISATPNLHSLKRSKKKSAHVNDVPVSTPRNLFYDFCDEEDERPRTPENMIRIIPESMSAIKKSHKKNRLSRRTEHPVPTYETDTFSEKLDISSSKLKTLEIEKAPSTPESNKEHTSPSYNVNSIKRSHKKDKANKKLPVQDSEDELSDNGSIFDYSEIGQENVEEGGEYASSLHNVSNSPLSNNIDKELNKSVNVEYQNAQEVSLENIDCQHQEELSKPPENGISITKGNVGAAVEERPRTPEIQEPVSVNRKTPENHTNYLQHILAESIKKSHKKIKDENRKRFFRSKNFYHQLESASSENTGSLNVYSKDQNDMCSSNENLSITKDKALETESAVRASTPENVNSSRLLLSQFSSIKKSHKKDKHNKIVSGFIKRQKQLKKDGDLLMNTQNVMNDSTESSLNTDSMEHDSPNCDINVSSNEGNNSLYESATECPNADSILELHVQNGTPHCKLSPSKRKMLVDESPENGMQRALEDSAASLIGCENAEEEFRIYTPIKKRRALPVRSDISEKAPTDIDASRCVTPVINYRNTSLSSDNDFVTPDDGQNDNCASSTVAPRSENPNGRSTPKNTLTADLLFDVNSIKKSHKKDKRRKGLRSSLVTDTDVIEGKINSSTSDDSEAKNIKQFKSGHMNFEKKNGIVSNNFSKTDSEQESFEMIDYSNPQPSTSKTNFDDLKCTQNDTVQSSVTPPNCLKVKSYMRLLQTTSIKKSHKKVREMKKHNMTNDALDLSDDGSLFGDEDKVDCIEQLQNNESENVNEHTAQICPVPNNTPASDVCHMDKENSCYTGNMINHGSIFDTEDDTEDVSDGKFRGVKGPRL